MTDKKIKNQQLLLLLSKKNDYITAEELSRELNISTKTVYRLVKKVNSEVAPEVLILSEKGRGYRLNYDLYIKSNQFLQNRFENQLSPEQRRNEIMEKLLLYSPKEIPIYELYSEYYVGDSVVFNDELVISEILQKYQLKLIRKNRTLSIVGSEINVRQAIKECSDIFNIIDLEELKHNQSLVFNHYDVVFLLDQIHKIEQNLNITIPYPYNVNIFSHLYILLNRMRRMRKQEFTKLTSYEKKIMAENMELYSISKTLVEQISGYLHQKLPEIETYFIYQYLVSSRIEDTNQKKGHYSSEVELMTNFYIDEMEKRLHFSIDKQGLYIDLANHLKPMLNRLKTGIRIKNGLLEQIKLIYSDIFIEIKQVSNKISKKLQLPAINDDENGFLTLYFAKIIETRNVHRPIKTLIMCTTGIGTSELLKAKIIRNFSEIEVMDVVSSRNMQHLQEKYPDVELLISTVRIKESFVKHHLLVSAMFTIDDQKRLRQKIEEIYHE